MPTITINLSTKRQLDPEHKALVEAIARAMMVDREIQIALKDLALNPKPQHFESAANAAVMALIALHLEEFKLGDD